MEAEFKPVKVDGKIGMAGSLAAATAAAANDVVI